MHAITKIAAVGLACAGTMAGARAAGRPAVLSGALLVLSVLTTSVAASIAWHAHPFHDAPLADAVHALFPRGGAWVHYDIPNVMLLAQAGPAALLLARHAQRVQIVCRVARVYAATMALRSMVILSTVVPDSSPQCHTAAQQRRPRPPHAAVHAISAKAWDIFRRGGSELTCGDMMFSGHTVVFVLSIMMWRDHLLPRASRLIVAWNVLGMCMIVITRLHYTMDVLVAVCVTWSAWRAVPLRAADPEADILRPCR